jgi:formylglycine-generating enzyme required for sulfatase activity
MRARHRFLRQAVVALGLFVSPLSTTLSRTLQTQIPCSQPLAFDDVVDLLAGGVPESRIGQFIEVCGVRFAVTPDQERRLRERRASDALVGRLAPPRNPAGRATWVSPIDRRELVWIPGGTFQMGSPSTERGRDEDEMRHSQKVSGFWLDTNEVTYEAFRRFVRANPEWQKDRVPRATHDGNYLRDWNGMEYPPGRADWPVVYVSWVAARAYVQWAGRRLPTEAEWEYACRAGTESAYWWGDAYFRGRVTPDPRPAGPLADQARRNPWGLFDMLGNVWEWTSTIYRPYEYRSDDGREDPTAAGPRVQRGGAWANGELIVRSANRKWESPQWTGDLVGFRGAL